MGLILEEKENSFTPISEGLHIAICTNVIDLGEHYSQEYGNIKPRVLLTWECLDETYEKDGQAIPATISREFGFSFHEKSTLRSELISWRGRDFTAEELKGFDLRNVLGKGCQLQVVHNTSPKGKVFANIKSIVSFPKGMALPAPTNELIAFDLDADTALEDMKKLPEWIQNKIKQSETYKNMVKEDGPFDDDVPPLGDDDLPF
jgi:hypothetical protein